MAQNPELKQGQTLARYVQNLWGDKVRLVPSVQVAVLTTPTRVIKNNPRRMGLIVVNLGSGTAYLDWLPSIAQGAGVPLIGAGSTLTLSAFEDGELCSYDMYAISAAAGNTLQVWEIETL